MRLNEFEGTGEERVFFQQFEVAYEYPVYFTRDLFSPGNTIFAEVVAGVSQDARPKVATFVDDGVIREMPDLLRRMQNFSEAYRAEFELAETTFVVKGGERAKNEPALVAEFQQRLVSLGLDRHSYVVGIGGGAMLDLVGYAAATTHRGIRHVRIPTTVLAQNNSGIGVKNGVNAFGIKNLLGTFVPPVAVINEFRLHRCLARSRQARGDGRGRQGGAHPRSRIL